LLVEAAALLALVETALFREQRVPEEMELHRQFLARPSLMQVVVEAVPVVQHWPHLGRPPAVQAVAVMASKLLMDLTELPTLAAEAEGAVIVGASSQVALAAPA
jgi:hypothetical protein